MHADIRRAAVGRNDMDKDLQQILNAYKAEFGKDLWIQEEDGTILASTLEPLELFLREALTGNLRPEEIRGRAQALGWEDSRERFLLLVEVSGREQALVKEVAANALGDALKDRLMAWLPEDRLALVISQPEGSLAWAEELAAFLQAGVETEVQVQTHIGISRRFRGAGQLPTARAEAETALLACRKLFREQLTVSYERLGLGIAACRMDAEQARQYLAGVLGDHPEKVMEDEELLHTARELLAHNLNGAETARQLYVHRNTLAYRLDKIEKMTGRDLRNFEDAAAFCLAMLLWEAGRR